MLFGLAAIRSTPSPCKVGLDRAASTDMTDLAIELLGEAY